MSEVTQLRKLAGWTQLRLAYVVGIDRGRLSAIERCEVTPTAVESSAIREPLLKAIAARREELSAVLIATGAQS